MWTIIKQNSHVAIVWVAFALMVIVSFNLVGEIVRRQLAKEAEASLNFIQAKIEADLQEPQTLMLSLSETIRGMILLGYDSDIVHEYINRISKTVVRNEARVLSSNSLYGVFEVFGNIYLNDNTWQPPPDFVPQERPWYKAAVAANGEFTFTQPYMDARTQSFVLSCARRVFDEEGNPLCVLSVDVPLDRITEYVVSTKLADGGYGLLLDNELNVLAHPNSSELGRPLRSWQSGIASLTDALERDKKVAERKVKNYMNIETIVFIRNIKNGWFVGIVTPYDKYYQDVNNMRIRLTLVGLSMAVSLSFIFLRIATEKTKANARNQQKSSFLARMSHEIRTPMNAILGITEIQLQNKALPQGASEAFTKINNSGDLLLGIINDILDLSKIEAGKLELTPAKYNVPSLINDTVQLNMLRYESKPVEFKLSVDENIPLLLLGDELRIKQILNNLLSNAFKYTNRGEVSLAVTLEHVPRAGALHVPLVFRISDTGQGMTAEQVRELGDEYSRFNLEANRMTEGTGLGISITRKLIKMMNGEFFVESKPGKGTIVTVRLPQRNITIGVSGTVGKQLAEDLQKFRTHNVSQKSKVQITYTPMPYGKVLIVDDVNSNLYVASGLMAPYYLTIETATSGFEAIEKIKNGAVFDIIFMDHMMPTMDGIEAAKKLRDLGYTHPIVALTANALAGQADVFLRNGFDAFISKPIDIRQLDVLLNKLIKNKYPPEVTEAAFQQAVRVNEAQPMEVQFASDPKLAAMFVLDAEKALAELNTVLTSGFRGNDDIRQYIIDVHSMKSALANVGETELSAVALKLELAGRAADMAVMTSETPAFLEALRGMTDKYRAKEDDGVIAQEEMDNDDRVYLSEKLLAIQTACEEYDVKAANEALAELGQKKWPQSIKELLDAISEYLLFSDFDEATKLAKDFGEN
jgi:signal transduction histidine kinase